ncbi:GLUG motif-containing protein, partial [Natrialbaceae archaeon A-CW2]
MTGERNSAGTPKRLLLLTGLVLAVIVVAVAGVAASAATDEVIEIEDIDDLQAIQDDPGADYVLLNDIDGTDTSTWNAEAGFEPIGDEDTPFTGTFDGQGYTISNVTIDRDNEDAIGLFGSVGNSGIVENVSLEDVTVVGDNEVAGLVGVNHGTVRDSSVSGTVTGQTWRTGGLIGDNYGTVQRSFTDVYVQSNHYQVGGLIGRNGGTGSVSESFALGDVVQPDGDAVGGLIGRNNGAVVNSYAMGTVTGKEAGGLIGFNSGPVSRSYSTGVVEGSGPTTYLGGVVGQDDGAGEVIDSYWDRENSGISSAKYGGFGDVNAEGLITPAMIGEAAETYLGALDFDSTWEIVDEGHEHADGAGYPILQSLEADVQIESTPTVEHPPNSGGAGTPDDPYLITDIDELQAIGEFPHRHYALDADLDASETAAWNGGSGFEPMAQDEEGFTGSFDGNGHTITGLTIDRETAEVGLFSRTHEEAEVRSVGLVDVNIQGGSQTGALVGVNHGSIEDVYVTGAVATDSADTGGLVGKNAGPISDSYSTASVTGSWAVGGLVGDSIQIQDASVTNSYATGDVHGEGDVGGLVGSSPNSPVTGSYATGTVEGSTNVGGLVGEFYGATVTRSFATGDVTGSGHNVGGLIGVSSTAGTIEHSFATGDVDGGTNVGGLVGTNRQGSSVSGSYAAGIVSGESVVGGLVGNNDGIGSEGVVSESYWDVQGTFQVEGVNPSEEGDFDAVGLSTDDMTGTSAASSMADFNFDFRWEPVDASHVAADSDGYPILQMLDAGPQVFQPADVSGTIEGTVTEAQSDDPVEGVTVSLLAGDNTFLETTTDENGHYSITVRGGTFEIDAVTAGYSRTSMAVVVEETETTVQDVDLPALTGSGTADDPYIVTDVTELQDIELDLEAHYALGNDVDAAETATWDGGAGFEPIGSEATAFDGSLDGQGYALSNLAISRKDDGDVGLFAVVGADAEVRNVQLIDATVHGDNRVGVVAGYTYGTVTGVSTTDSDVTGLNIVGGLAGVNEGTIDRSHAQVSVHATGEVAGGIVGANLGIVDRVFAVGSVSADDDDAGLLGALYDDEARLERAYWDTGTTEQDAAVGLDHAGIIAESVEGLNTSEMQGAAAADNMSAFDFETVWATTDAYPALQSHQMTDLPGTLTGVVTDAEASSPIEGATVEVFDGSDQLVSDGLTNETGSYAIEVPTGAYALHVDSEGYLTETIEDVEVDSEETTTVDVALTPDPVTKTALENASATFDDLATAYDAGAADLLVDDLEDALENEAYLDESAYVDTIENSVLHYSEGVKMGIVGQVSTASWNDFDDAISSLETALEEDADAETLALELDALNDAAAELEGWYFAVELQAVDTEVVVGETLTLPYEVTNTGIESGTQQVDLLVNGSTVATETHTVDASTSLEGEFTYETTQADAPSIDVVVQSPDDTDVTFVAIEEQEETLDPVAKTALENASTSFEGVSEEFDSPAAGTIVEEFDQALEGEIYDDNGDFALFIDNVTSLLEEVSDEIDGQVTDSSLADYDEAVTELHDLVESQSSPEALAAGLDAVSESADALEPSSSSPGSGDDESGGDEDDSDEDDSDEDDSDDDDADEDDADEGDADEDDSDEDDAEEDDSDDDDADEDDADEGDADEDDSDE